MISADYIFSENFIIYLFLSFNLGFSWHEICPLALIAIFIKEFLANQEGIFYAMKNLS